MSERFYSILTLIGQAKIANSQVTGEVVALTQMAMGDGNGNYYDPTASQTELRHEVWRANINSIEIDETNPNWILISTFIPSNVGGFTIREVGVFDADGDMIAIGKYPETYKPILEEGSAKDLYVRMIMEVSNASSVTLRVDPSVIMASREYVDNKFKEAEAYTTNHIEDILKHKQASGITQTGDLANAEGLNTIASGDYSHSEGDATIASGARSHAEGNRTTAIGDNSHAEGNAAEASGINSHAEGNNTQANGVSSHAEGNGTIASGTNSHAEGSQTEASGINSHAEGSQTEASGHASHAEGNGTIAYGSASHAEGESTVASGRGSHAEGYGTVAGVDGDPTEITIIQAGVISHAEGNGTKASGFSSHAEGRGTIASGSHSHAEGRNTQAIGDNSHAEGENTQSNGYASHTEGISTNASGRASHAEGQSTTASASNTHAEGYQTTASGVNSHAEGGGTTASGSNSHAEGSNTEASGSFSHSEGNGTIANVYSSHAQGRFNNPMQGNSNVGVAQDDSFVIGNGTNINNRGNAFRVTFDGRVFALSAFNSTGADYAEFFEWEDGNPDDEDRVGYFVTLVGDKIKKAMSDDYIVGIISANPSIIGDSHNDDWHEKYIRDEWGRIQYHWIDMPKEDNEDEAVDGEEIEDNDNVEEIEVENDENKVETEEEIEEVEKAYVPILNPNWNNEEEYIKREDRPEWSTVGMLGKLRVRDDGTCEVNGFCAPTDDGIATKSDVGYRVIKRISDNVVEVIFR